LKWDIYQGDDNANDQQNGQQDDQQATSKRPASDHIEEVKKLKKERKTNVSARYEYPADFMDFWSIYPRRENKTQARKEWEFEKAHNPKFAQEKILQAARTYADETNGRDRDRIKMPSTFLHAGTWLEKVYIEEATA